MKYLLSTTELETAIEAIFIDQQGHCFPVQVTNLVQRIVDSFNADEQVNHRAVIGLMDDLGDDFSQVLYDYKDIVDAYRTPESAAEVIYHPREQTLEAVYCRRLQREDPLDKVRAQLTEELDRGDFIPEKLRVAYTSILGS